MATTVARPPPRGRLARSGLAVAVLALTMVAGGCAQVPDALNPAEWYKSTIDFFGGDDPENAEADRPKEQSRPVADRGQPPPGADKPFPSLATVPDRPPAPSASERRQVVEGLVADRARARYSSEVLRQGEPTETLRSGATAAVGVPAPPPPPAVPTVPVRRETVPAALARAAPPSLPPAVGAAAPPPTASVQEVYRARLAQRSVQGGAAQPTPANALSPGAAPPFETVVVSSAGVQVGGKAPAAAARPTPAPPPLGGVVAALPDAAQGAASLKVATILFDNGSARLSRRDHDILRGVVRLQRQRGGRVRVIGHASSRTRSMDPVRHKMVNFKVSADRAQAVRDALVRAGLGRQDIGAQALSDSRPLYYEVMPSGEAGNRRAEIFIER
jgi:outer membrane protein OmpA-like peptidoglycan-associated protein